jgi:hypothetical protein
MIAKHNFFLGFVWVVAFWCRLWFWVAFWLCRLPQADGELRAFPTLPCDFSSIPPSTYSSIAEAGMLRLERSLKATNISSAHAHS